MGFINQLIVGGAPQREGTSQIDLQFIFGTTSLLCRFRYVPKMERYDLHFLRCRRSILRWGVCGSVRCPTWGSDVLSPQIPRFKSLDPQLAVRSPGYEFTCCWRNRWKVLLIQKARDVAGVWQLCFTTLVTQNHPITSCQIGAYPIMNL